MRIIAFNGIARGGKTTCAEFMEDWCNRHDMQPVRCSFADPMKKAAGFLGLSKDKNPDVYRSTLQRWGETRRDPSFRPGKTGPDYWVNRVRELIVKQQFRERLNYKCMDKANCCDMFKETVLIFDDLRYLNELELVKEFNGITVFVDGVVQVSDLLAKWRMHESEAMAMGVTLGIVDGDELFDYYLPNEGSLENLKYLIEQLAPAWLDHDHLCRECGGQS